MPYVRHESAHAISKALIASASVTDLVYARTVKLAGVWFVLSATPKLQEDQTCSIYITLAKSRFVVEQYSGHSARDGVSSFRVYNVPVSQAQGVINAWKTVDGTVGGVARKGANGSIESYSGDRCNIELSISVENAESNSKVAYRTDYFKSSVSTDNSNQTSALAHPAFSAGKIITTANAKTKLGNYDTSNDEDAAIKREWTDTYPTRDGTVSVYQGRNLTSAELVIAKAAFGMTTALDNRWSASPNEFGLWDYSLIIPPSPGNGQLGWVPCETTWNYYEEQFNKDATRFRLLRYTMGLKQSADLSAITTWLGTNGGVNSVEPLNSGWKSRFKRFEDAGAWQTVGGT
jgi:hypothetical protein